MQCQEDEVTGTNNRVHIRHN